MNEPPNETQPTTTPPTNPNPTPSGWEKFKDFSTDSYVPTQYTSYSQVAFYRRQWFVFLCLLLIIPLGIIIMLTGDVFVLSKAGANKGSVMKYSGKTKKKWIFNFVLLWIVVLSIRFSR